ncbi:MAG: hypothetical protein HRJ53_29580 [Acidobacteria bacterium Pan2503]|uniref:Uncharacterized protein n=1 Tax=Candidatus Acidiferrum panamense TaxID=2741543 RepID=A0A7V8T0X8_9BACT|nr:hypothetical protein [Candidatus Acidoferrum panamensis]
MSTGENINANGVALTQEMVRMGFHKFPQSEIALVAPDVWPQVAPILFAAGYPFQAQQSALVPSGEVWFIDLAGSQLGRIVNVAVSDPAPQVTKSLETTTKQTDPDNTHKRVKKHLL